MKLMEHSNIENYIVKSKNSINILLIFQFKSNIFECQRIVVLINSSN